MTSLPPASADAAFVATNFVPHLSQSHLDRGYGSVNRPPFLSAGSGATQTTDFRSISGNPQENSPLAQSASQQYGRFNEEWDASQRGSSIIEGPTMRRTLSNGSQGEILAASRGGTLKKKASLKRTSSLKRSGSRRSSRAGSVRSLALQSEGNELYSAFYSPVPTTGNPTEILANRFQIWRKVLKDLIAYFREIQSQYEQKSKTLLKVSNVINNTSMPTVFLQSGGIGEGNAILRQYHKESIAESNRARVIENDVCLALTGLRSDLQQKIKEIKNLSADFKNSVDKEIEATRRAVQNLGEALGQSDLDSSTTTGKQDPYLLRLAVDRQVERQIDEENYLHQAYLNLETSGRELEAIVVGEIQKSYNALAGILKREGDQSYETIENLRAGPITMPKDEEWNAFVEKDERFVDPRIPVRSAQSIQYPGRDHELATEVRAGLLERKSKYLKSYTAGWYVLSPTHLHEFKSADKTQAPIMSLYLPEQKLGSHSAEGASSNKFMFKGRQTGSLHRGHSWVFRAESYDTMLAWFEDIKSLTEKSPQERTAFVRQHARSVSGTSQKAGSISSDGAVDEEDDEPFAAPAAVVTQGSKQDVIPTRPKPGGRFPSDLAVNSQRGLQVPLSPSSGSSGFADFDTKDNGIVAAAADLPGSGIGQYYPRQPRYGADAGEPSHASQLNHYAEEDGRNPYTAEPIQKRDTIETPDAEFGALDASGLVGSGAAEAHREAAASTAPEVYDIAQEAQLAAQEASQIAVHDTNEVLATHGAAAIAAADTDITHNAPAFTALTSPTLGSRLEDDNPPFSAASTDISISPEPSVVSSPTQAKPPTLGEILVAGQHHQSVSTIAHLHIPGEFPKQDSSVLKEAT